MVRLECPWQVAIKCFSSNLCWIADETIHWVASSCILNFTRTIIAPSKPFPFAFNFNKKMPDLRKNQTPNCWAFSNNPFFCWGIFILLQRLWLRIKKKKDAPWGRLSLTLIMTLKRLVEVLSGEKRCVCPTRLTRPYSSSRAPASAVFTMDTHAGGFHKALSRSVAI